MKQQFPSSAISTLLFILAAGCYAQDLDLIVTAKGDSIACRIDSVTENRIYFEMKINSRWIHTQIELPAVIHFEKKSSPQKRLPV